MRNLIRLFVLAVFTCAIPAQTTVYLELDRENPQGCTHPAYKVPDRKVVIARLLEKAKQESLDIQFAREESSAGWVLTMNRKGWGIESANNPCSECEEAPLEDLPSSAYLFENAVEDIIQVLKYLQ